MTSPARRRAAAALDWLIVASLAAAVVMELTGGFFLRAGFLRISARSADRALLVVFGLLVVRRLVAHSVPPFGMAPSLWRERLRRLFVPRVGAPESSSAPGSWRRLAAASLGLCAVGAVILHQQLRHMDAVPDLGDPLLSIWRMTWVWQQVQGDPRPLFNANIFHPDPVALTYSDAMLLPALTAAPLLAIGVHPVVAYNVLFLSGFFLSGIATYVLVDRLTGSPLAAFVSGILFAFYAYRFEHYSHLELQMTQWIPLALLALHRFFETGAWRYGIGAALVIAAQLYSSMYYAVFFAVYASAVAGVWLALQRRPLKHFLVRGAAAAALACVLAIPLARAYLAPERAAAVREVADVAALSAEPSDYLRVHRRSMLYSGRIRQEHRPERELFPGFLPLTLAAAGLAPPLCSVRVAYLAGLVLAFDASLGFHGVLYPYLYEWLPPVRYLRVPARFSIFFGLSLVVLAGFGTRRLLRRFGHTPPRQRFVVATIVVAAIVEAMPTLALEPVWRDPPPTYAAIAAQPGAVLAEFPVPRNVDRFVENTPYMYFAHWHWAPMLNGYSGFGPPTYVEFVDAVREFPTDRSIEFLRRRGVSHVTINCALMRADCRPFVRNVESSAAFRRVVQTTWEGHPAYLYELIR